MSEEPRRQAVVLGLFVSVGVVILVLTLLTLGSQRPGFARSFEVTAEFPEVSGLAHGDAVWYAGVPVGAVRRVQLVGPGRVAVDLAIGRQVGRHIPSDVVAKLSTDGLIGSPIVTLTEGGASGETLEPGDALSVAPSVSTDDVLASLQAVATGLERGEGTLGRLLADERLYVELSSAAARVGGLASDVRDGVSDRDTPIGLLLNDPEAGEDLEDALAGLEQVSDKLDETIEAAQHNFLLRGYFRKQERQQRKQERKGRATVLVPPGSW